LALHLANNRPAANVDHLYIYAIIPMSLEMPVGKLGAQLGHAFGDSLKEAERIDPERASRYRNHEYGGSKVAMKTKKQEDLLKACDLARERGIPCALVSDSHHILPPHFDGTPVITALGIGPCTKAEAKELTKKFQCL
jgi:PTH2 family peptidyl-tRNA hydrolase